MAKISPLSKSQYTKGISCAKKLWLYRERRDLAAPVSPVQEAIFTQGHEVGKLAHLLFPGGVLIEQDHADPDGAISATQKAINDGATAVFEAAFLYEDVLVRSDIIAKNDDGSWDLLEVKSSTKVKPEHHADVAIQKFVLSKAGLKLRRSCLVHLNNRYVKKSDAIDVGELFCIVALDDIIKEEYGKVVANLLNLKELVKRTAEPNARIGSVCKSPHVCEFKNYCWDGVPEGSIHFLGRIGDGKRNDLLDQGISVIAKIPEGFELSEAQMVEAECARTGKVYFDKKLIQKHLSTLKWPLYFLDFETVGYAVPEFLGTRSYESLTFQYSLHVQDRQDAEITHKEFLCERLDDPRLELVEKLVKDIGPTGSIVAYHASFERSRLEELIGIAPTLKTSIESILGRLWDLEAPFSKRWYWDQRFQGSSSIKKVLPVLVPEMNYKNLAVQKGDEAQLRYNEFIRLPVGDSLRIQIRRDLLEYCKQDTLAMVKVLDVLRKTVD